MNKTAIKKFAILGCMALLLAVTYWTNCFDGSNGITYQLSSNSELLAIGSSYNDYAGGEQHGYGLGWYVTYNSASGEFYSEEGYESGYCLNESVIVVDNCEETRSLYIPGNQIQFYSGEIREIVAAEEQDEYLFITYGGDEILTGYTSGTLLYARVLDAEGNVCKSGYRTSYESSLGLQGHVFQVISKLLPVSVMRGGLKFLCALLMGIVATAICWLLKQKYDKLMAGVFYVVFWLSPLVVAFGSNMYWLEGILFLPMLIGLWCSININNKKRRIVSYILTFVIIMIKSMCGYEYLTTVMMSLIIFLLADLLAVCMRKSNKAEGKLLLRTIFILGVCAVAGFLFTVVVHAYARGGGDIGAGLTSIYEKDILRRTLGGDASNFSQDYTDSIKASVISVLLKYFNFDNAGNVFQIVEGIDANLFPVFALSSAVLVILGVKEKKFSWNIVGLYIWSFLSCISWFVLGKSHSAAHPFLNYILWYFGYIQMMFYVILRYVAEKWAMHSEKVNR